MSLNINLVISNCPSERRDTMQAQMDKGSEVVMPFFFQFMLAVPVVTTDSHELTTCKTASEEEIDTDDAIVDK